MSHIVVWRPYGLLGVWHHGILLPDNTVVHYTAPGGGKRKPTIRRTTLPEFAKGRTVYDVLHELKLLPKEKIVERALSCVGEGEYHLLFKNCESFVNWAILDAQVSKQAAPLQLAALYAFKAYDEVLGEDDKGDDLRYLKRCLKEKTTRRKRRMSA